VVLAVETSTQEATMAWGSTVILVRCRGAGCPSREGAPREGVRSGGIKRRGASLCS
jgi:hypothetical protein